MNRLVAHIYDVTELDGTFLMLQLCPMSKERRCSETNGISSKVGSCCLRSIHQRNIFRRPGCDGTN